MAGAGGSPPHLLGMLFSLTDSLQLPASNDKRNLLPSGFSNRGPQPARQLRNDRVRQRGHSWDMVSCGRHSCSPVVVFLLSVLLSATRSTKNSFLPSACKEKSFFFHHHLPSSTQPSATSLCYKCALRDTLSPFTSPALDRKKCKLPPSSSSRLV